MKCKKCNNETEFIKAGIKYLSGKKYQRYQCKKCGTYIPGEMIR
jgi:hypothetical protein